MTVKTFALLQKYYIAIIDVILKFLLINGHDFFKSALPSQE